MADALADHGVLAATDALGLAVRSVAVFMATNILNFLMVAGFHRAATATSIRRNLRDWSTSRCCRRSSRRASSPP